MVGAVSDISGLSYANETLGFFVYQNPTLPKRSQYYPEKIECLISMDLCSHLGYPSKIIISHQIYRIKITRAMRRQFSSYAMQLMCYGDDAQVFFIQ